MLLDSILDTLLLEILGLILLQVKADLGTTTERWVGGVEGDSEGATSRGLPDVLLVVVVFRDDLNTLGDEIGGIEADTELANHGNISAGAERFHKALRRCVRMTSQTIIIGRLYLRPRLGNGTEVIDHVSLGHTDTTVTEAEHLVFFVRDYTNEKLLL